MCECSRDATALDSFDKDMMKEACIEITKAFKDDSYILVLDGRWDLLFDYGSSLSIAEEHKYQFASIIEAIRMGENAIRQFNSGWRQDEIKSFRLLCHSSRVYTFVIPTCYRLIIINKIKSIEEASPVDDKLLKDLCDKVKRSIRVLSSANVPYQ